MENLIVKLSGTVQNSNFHEWKNDLIGQIKSTQLELKTDNDFAVAELNVKNFKKYEKVLKDTKNLAIQQASDIHDLFNAMDEIIEQARQARLTLERQIKIKKNDIKERIALDGIEIIIKEIRQQSKDFSLLDNSVYIDRNRFLSEIKGARGIDGSKKAVDRLCLRIKDEISEKALLVKANGQTIDSLKAKHLALFQDRVHLINLSAIDLNKTIDERIKIFNASQKISNETPSIREETPSIREETPSIREELFLSIILKGIDPLTGEIFPAGHAWLHPKITSDIKEYFRAKELSDHPPEITSIKNNSVLKNIKSSVKSEYDIDLVLIESGAYVKIIEEDAEYFFKEFDFKQNKSFSFPSTGFPTQIIENYKKKLKDKKVKFCYLEQHKYKADNKRGFNIIREVVFSTDPLALGFTI